MCLFDPQTLDPKCIGLDWATFGWEMGDGLYHFGGFSFFVTGELICTGVFSQRGHFRSSGKKFERISSWCADRAKREHDQLREALVGVLADLTGAQKWDTVVHVALEGWDLPLPSLTTNSKDRPLTGWPTTSSKWLPCWRHQICAKI